MRHQNKFGNDASNGRRVESQHRQAVDRVLKRRITSRRSRIKECRGAEWRDRPSLPLTGMACILLFLAENCDHSPPATRAPCPPTSIHAISAGRTLRLSNQCAPSRSANVRRNFAGKRNGDTEKLSGFSERVPG